MKTNQKRLLKFIRLVICFSFLITPLINPQPVYACSCAMPGPPDEALSAYDVVFAGRVIKTTYLQDLILSLFHWTGNSLEDYREQRRYGFEVTFAVSKSWKLVNTTIVQVVTGYGGGDCGYRLITGNEYLIYASYVYGEPGNYLVTGSCGRNAKLSDAGEDLSYLNTREPIKLTPTPSQTLSIIILVSFVFLAISIYWGKRTKGINNEY